MIGIQNRNELNKHVIQSLLSQQTSYTNRNETEYNHVLKSIWTPISQVASSGVNYNTYDISHQFYFQSS